MLVSEPDSVIYNSWHTVVLDFLPVLAVILLALYWCAVILSQVLVKVKPMFSSLAEWVCS